MRALVTTVLTLAFAGMATVTYLAVRGDPMGGEPRLIVKISPPDPTKMPPVASASPEITVAPAPNPASAGGGIVAAPADEETGMDGVAVSIPK